MMNKIVFWKNHGYYNALINNKFLIELSPKYKIQIHELGNSGYSHNTEGIINQDEFLTALNDYWKYIDSLAKKITRSNANVGACLRGEGGQFALIINEQKTMIAKEAGLSILDDLYDSKIIDKQFFTNLNIVKQKTIQLLTPSVKKDLEVELAKLKLENAKPNLYNAFEKGFFGKKFKTKGKVAKDGTVGILIQFNYFLRFLQDYLAEITMKALNKNKQLKFEPKIFSIIIYAFMKAFQTGRFNSHIEITVGKMDESEVLQLLCELYEENLKTDTHIADYLNNKFKK